MAQTASIISKFLLTKNGKFIDEFKSKQKSKFVPKGQQKKQHCQAEQLLLWCYPPCWCIGVVALPTCSRLVFPGVWWCVSSRLMCACSIFLGIFTRKTYRQRQQLSPWNFFLSSNIHRDTKDFVLTDIHLKQKAEWHMANGSCMSTAVQRHCGQVAKIFLFCIPCLLICTRSLGICRHHGIMTACASLPTTFPTIILFLCRCTNRLIKGG